MKETAIDILFLDELTQVPEVKQSFQSNLRVITIFVINWMERILSRGKFAFRCSIIYLWQRKYPLAVHRCYHCLDLYIQYQIYSVSPSLF